MGHVFPEYGGMLAGHGRHAAIGGWCATRVRLKGEIKCQKCCALGSTNSECSSSVSLFSCVCTVLLPHLR
jgi:hypothetical protein